MSGEPKLAGVELIVADLEAALALFQDGLGLELVDRVATADPLGEMAILNAGPLALTLLEPASEGPGEVLARREPRATQLVFSADAGELDGIADQLVESGFAIQAAGANFFVPPEVGEGALGFPLAAVVTPSVDDEAV